MKIRVVAVLSGVLCLTSEPFAQEGSTALDPIDVRVTEEMVAAATMILESTRTGVPQQGDGDSGTNRVERMMSYSREELLSYPAMDEARRDWAYWPRPRVGLSLEQMTTEQRTMVHDLLNTLLSSVGYLKTVHVMQTDEILRVWDDSGIPRGKEKYWLSLFGTPSMDEPWGWRFEGHHVSLNISVAPGGNLRVTPTFFGADPAEIPQGALSGFRPHAATEDLGRDLILSMDAAQREIAVIADQPPRDVFAGNLGKPEDDWETWRQTLQPEGIAIKDLSAQQRHIAQRILDEVVATYRPEVSSAYLRTIDIDELSFAWMGSVERRAPHYYRLQGSDFVFEYDNVQDDANHVHSVWRSKAGDFGDDLLLDHYQSSHR